MMRPFSVSPTVLLKMLPWPPSPWSCAKIHGHFRTVNVGPGALADAIARIDGRLAALAPAC